MAMNYLAFRAAGITSRLGRAGANVATNSSPEIISNVSRLVVTNVKPSTDFRSIWQSMIWPVASGGPQTFFVTKTFTGIGTVSLQKQVNLFKAITATGTLAFQALLVFLRSFSYTATGTSTLQKQVNLFRGFVATGTVDRQRLVFKGITITAVGTAALARQLAKTFAYVANGAAALQREIRLFRSITAVGTLTTIAQTALSVARSFTATGTLTLTALFQPAAAAVPAALKAIRRLFRRVRQ